MGVTPHNEVDLYHQSPEESSSCFENRDRKLGTLQITGGERTKSRPDVAIVNRLGNPLSSEDQGTKVQRFGELHWYRLLAPAPKRNLFKVRYEKFTRHQKVFSFFQPRKDQFFFPT